MKITMAQDGIALNSPEEALFYGLCCFHEIPVEHVLLSARLEHDGPLWHWNGFHVTGPGSLNMSVEISDGSNEASLRRLRDAFRQSGHRLAVLYREELRVLMTRANGHQVEKQLRIWAR